MSEEAKSLFEYKQELQSAIWFENAPLDATLDLAVQAVIEAGKPEQAGDYYRPCVHEDLLLVYQMMDLPGYAIELETIASRFIAEIPSSRQCHFCMATLHVQGLLGQRRYADADRAAALHLAELGLSPEHRNRRLDLVMLRADIAAAAGDLVALRLHVEELCRELPKISRGDNVLRAGIWCSALRLVCVEGDANAAARLFEQIVAEVQATADFALAARVVYAGYLARTKRSAEAFAVIEGGLVPARTRQAHRWHAELLAIGHALDGRYASELATVLKRLKSRDLDGALKVLR